VARTHYHVGSNMTTYSPEPDNVYTVTSKRDAQRALAEEARRYRESEYDLPRSERRTGHGSARDGYVHFIRPGDAYDLGLSFWWTACIETECESDGEG